MFTVTREWLMRHLNEGAPNRNQILALGQSWPVPQGWIPRLEGLQITDEQRKVFEMARKRKRHDNVDMFA